jgi:hypothetical protein
MIDTLDSSKLKLFVEDCCHFALNWLETTLQLEQPSLIEFSMPRFDLGFNSHFRRLEKF